MNVIKELINFLSDPKIIFTPLIIIFFFVFPPTDFCARIQKRLKLHLLWTNRGGLFLLICLVIGFVLGYSDPNAQKILTKPDNVPITALIILITFFGWFSMAQGYANDRRIANQEKPDEYYPPNDKVMVWPDLVYIEFIAIIVGTVMLMAWSYFIKAPLEEPANLADSPNPSKAPWYFLGLQEMLVYFDPWLAGVLFPTLILVGLMAIPYIDKNPKGQGYYTFRERRAEISIFLFGFLLLWVFLICVGTFLRGPNWNFFGPFEPWTAAKLEALNNINLSELIYVKLLSRPLPANIFIRELWGFLLIGGYFMIFPPLLARTALRKYYDKLGVLCYSIFVVLLLSALALPIKMYLRWLFNLKYLVSIPEYFFNI